jgi:hypothetical protein
MEKLAIFVEGQTEQIFVSKLLEEVAEKSMLAIECTSGEGGSGRSIRTFKLVKQSPVGATSSKYYILIYRSNNDSRVVSDIRDQHSSLTGNGYKAIIGLRDVYPKSRADIPAIKQNSQRVLPKAGTPIFLVFAILEIEAWFLAEYSHFTKIDPCLTSDSPRSRNFLAVRQ